MKPEEKLIVEIDHAVHQRHMLEDNNFAKEVLMATDRYLSAKHGVRLPTLIEPATWLEKFVSMRGKLGERGR